MTNTAFQHPTPDVLHVPVMPAVVRPYDYRKGDERRSGLNNAIDRAKARVEERGRQQQIRPDNVDRLAPDLWVIQDIEPTETVLVTD